MAEDYGFLYEGVPEEFLFCTCLTICLIGLLEQRSALNITPSDVLRV